jgi:outer membrane protein assembly factor BamB
MGRSADSEQNAFPWAIAPGAKGSLEVVESVKNSGGVDSVPALRVQASNHITVQDAVAPSLPARLASALASGANWLFGALTLIVFLAVLSAVPILQFLSLGYLLEAGGRVARTRRVAAGFFGMRKAARLGGFIVGCWLFLLPVRLIADMARAAEIIDPGGPVAGRWRRGLVIVMCLTLIHLISTCARGGKLRYFVWPFNFIWLARRLRRGGYYVEARDAVWEASAALRLPYYFWLGCRGFIGALAWLALPVTLIALSRGGWRGATLVGFSGAFLLMLVLLYLPFLQLRMAMTNRLRSMFDVRSVRAEFCRAPWAFACAFFITLLFALPLYLLKIELIPREAAWLPSLVFIVFIFPARLLAGWALARAAQRQAPRHWFIRWTGRLPLLPIAALYVLIAFFTQYTSWNGAGAILWLVTRQYTDNNGTCAKLPSRADSRRIARSTHQGELMKAAVARLGLGSLFLVVAGFALADDWPQWRGPERTGISQEKGLLKDWPKDGPKLVWQVTDIGEGYSTPAVVGDRLYLMGNKGTTDEYVLALDAKDGKIIWKAGLGKVGPNQMMNYSGARSTPTIDGDSIYALSSDGELGCLETATGKVKWRKELRAEFEGKPGYWAYAESPLVDGDLVICSPGGSVATLVALKKHTGEPVWKTAVPGGDKAAYASVTAVEAAGRKQYVQFFDKGVVGVDAKTGEFLWRYDNTGKTMGPNIGTPISHDGFVYSAAKAGGGLVKLKASDKGVSAEQVYLERNLPNGVGGAVRVGDYLYGTTNEGLVCANYKTGKAMWRDKTLGSASVCCADGRLYVHCESGDVALVEATPDAYREKGRFKPSGQPKHIRQRETAWVYPVVANGKLYVRDLGVLWCFDVKDSKAAAE